MSSVDGSISEIESQRRCRFCGCGPETACATPTGPCGWRHVAGTDGLYNCCDAPLCTVALAMADTIVTLAMLKEHLSAALQPACIMRRDAMTAAIGLLFIQPPPAPAFPPSHFDYESIDPAAPDRVQAMLNGTGKEITLRGTEWGFLDRNGNTGVADMQGDNEEEADGEFIDAKEYFPLNRGAGVKWPLGYWLLRHWDSSVTVMDQATFAATFRKVTP